MKNKAAALARTLFAFVFFVFGLNGFLHFLPQPALAGVQLQFVSGLAASGYFFALLKGTEVVASLLLLSGRYVPLALTVLAPIVVNIVAFHAFLAPAGMPLALLVLALELFLAWSYRSSYRSVLKAQVEPDPVRVAIPRVA